MKSLGPFDLGALAGLQFRGAHDGLPDATNLHAEFQLTWWPGKALLTSP